MNVAVVILTYNEQIHIRRCINSVKQISDEIIIVDSYSNDETINIANDENVRIYQHKFINNGKQFQWALDNVDIRSEWIMKVDADEILTDELIMEINNLNIIDSCINGFKINCRVYFLQKWIKHGVYPLCLPRIIRKNFGFMSDSYMDEHLMLRSGHWEFLRNDFIDFNLNSLTWWINKHNNYASREALMRFMYIQERYSGFKKNKIIYLKIPPIIRGFVYFLYRYFLRLGFLDGFRGFYWHFLQGFWYQILIDAKLYQMVGDAKRNKLTTEEIIKKYLNTQ
jgi:glycosyltransferase involved in cell wall biosynthesis